MSTYRVQQQTDIMQQAPGPSESAKLRRLRNGGAVLRKRSAPTPRHSHVCLNTPDRATRHALEPNAHEHDVQERAANPISPARSLLDTVDEV